MIKFEDKTKTYKVTYSARPSGGGIPVSYRRIGIKTIAEAKRVERELIVLVNEKLKSNKMPKWEKHLDNYFKHLLTVDITNTTRYNREKLLRFRTQEIWKHKYVDEITHEDIHNLITTKMENHTESYKKCVLKYIRGAFEYAVESRLIIRNPTPQMKFKILNRIKAVLNQDQIESLLRKTQQQNWAWYPHYAMAVFTGLRNGELYALKWENVNLDKRQILVNSAWSSKDGFKTTK